MFFYVFNPRTNQKLFDNVYVGLHWPLGTAPIQRRGDPVEVAWLAATDYEAIEENLEGLTTDVPDTSIDEISRHYQRHTMGISISLSRLLHRVAREVLCYCEQHPWCYFVYEAMCFIFWYCWSSDKHILWIFFIVIYIHEDSIDLLALCTTCDWIYKCLKCLSNT